MPNPKDYPVLSATLVAPVVVWLGARYFPGLKLTDEQATIIATGALGAGSFLATNLVRSRRTLPDPDATKDNAAVQVASRGTAVAEPTTYTPTTIDPPLRSRVRPTTYRVQDETVGGYSSGDTPAAELRPPASGIRRTPPAPEESQRPRE